jgi:hypothetical protein
MEAIAAFLLAAAGSAPDVPQPCELGGGAKVVRAVAMPDKPPFVLLGPAPAIIANSGVRLAGAPVDPQAPRLAFRPTVTPIY